MDWFSESYENVTETSGLVFRVDSNWLYILTSSRFIKSAQQITVTFPGGEVADAAVRRQDTVTELAILEIPLKYKGIHDPEHFRNFDQRNFQRRKRGIGDRSRKSNGVYRFDQLWHDHFDYGV
jgi:hypothetical protein